MNMELLDILYLMVFLIVALAAIKGYQATEIQKQERVSEERERKAQIYASKDISIANTEAMIYNQGFDGGSDEQSDMSQILGLLQNPEIAKLAEQFFKPKQES